MARLTGCGESRSGVIGRGCSRIISLVAGVAIGVCAQLTMVKECIRESRRGVAVLTGMGKIHRNMVGRLGVISLMAGVAIDGRP